MLRKFRSVRVFVFSFCLALSFLSISDFKIATVSSQEGQLDRKSQYRTGLELADPATYQSVPLAQIPYSGVLPPSVNLSKNFPPPGDQGQQSSCVGWAVAYALKSYQEYNERQWSPFNDAHTFSPAYVYNSIKTCGDCSCGTLFVDAFNFITKEGTATQELFPYSKTNCSKIPNETIKKQSRDYRIATWRRVNVQDITEVQTYIAAGIPVVIGMLVDNRFMKLRSETYDNYSGSPLGGHALVVIGYDDSKKAFRIINSWGTAWGDGGYGWVGYEAFRKAVREGYVTQDHIGSVPDPLTNTYYYIQTKVSGLNLDVYAGQKEVGAHIVQAPQHPEQVWKLIDAGNGYYYIQTKVSGLNLDVYAGQKEVGAHIVQAAPNPEQVWKLIYAGNGYYYIQTKISGLNLDVYAGQKEIGAHIVQAPPHPEQVWKFIPAK